MIGSNLNAVILAGGLGTRLRPVVESQPKVLAEVAGKPFLAFLLEQLKAAGIRRVVLATGYLGEQIESQFGPSYEGLELVYSKEPEPLGTAGALRLAQQKLTADELIVMNGDSFCRAEIEKLYAFFLEKQADVCILSVNQSDRSRYGALRIGADGRIQAFEEKHEQTEGWINAGVYLIKRQLLKEIPQGSVSLEREIFPRWLERKVFAYCSPDALFLDIGTPESLEAARKEME